MTTLPVPRGNVGLSARLLTMAWAIEIIAAMVGLFLALSRMMGPQAGEDLSFFMGFQGALPFFAVMIIELTKIPLATVLYASETLRWRLIFFFSLILTMVITFETFFIGFEQYQSLLMRDLRGITTEIAEQKRIISGSNKEKDDSEGFLENRGEAAQASRDNEASINNKFDLQENELRRQQDAILKKYEVKAGPLKGEQKRADADLAALEKRLKTELDRIQKEREAAIATDAASKGAETDNRFARLDALQKQKQQIRTTATKRRNQIVESSGKELEACVFCDDEKKRREVDLAKVDEDERRALANIDRQEREINNQLSGGTSASSNIRATFDSEIQKARESYESEKRDLLKKRADLAQRLAIATGNISKTDKRQIDALNSKLTKIGEQRKAELNREKERFDAQQAGFDDQSTKAQQASNTVAEARKAMVPLCTTLNDKVADNQIFRLAMQIYGSDDACALEEDQLSFTKAIWFGSLAIIVSALGTILALAALVVRHPPVATRPLSMRLRLALLAIRKRMNNPRVVTKNVEVEKIIEVTKEVPVDKVAFKEVPVEVVKREVVHIPVYTNDLSLLGKNFDPQSEQ
ncbi:MAG: hypothetical protein HOI80_00325 [Alphaproteobacteria bacterium]|nr:hypothetical protein [Alphaproteobacteria bacterium]